MSAIAFFTRRLIAAGVDPETAAKEACHMEHGISEESFQKLEGRQQKAERGGALIAQH